MCSTSDLPGAEGVRGGIGRSYGRRAAGGDTLPVCSRQLDNPGITQGLCRTYVVKTHKTTLPDVVSQAAKYAVFGTPTIITCSEQAVEASG